ncbi:hypothetical protein [Brachybacterium sp. J153]|uniref:hypothetical protein n=1 Tax=Brachybacterium sp. J153 TaxID=3116488 RepID=UPI002E788E8B|nr:hypothetical protein [Brachybacterium sp. J153]MEE1619288.1 hypothetical protein [Brachybacterium sp. J153]
MTDQTFTQPFPVGEPNDAFAQHLTGRSFLAPLTRGAVTVSRVTFEPGCRNNWHVAKAGSWFSHLALITPGEGVRTEWLEPVTDAEYEALPVD